MWHERLTCPWPCSRTVSEPAVKLRKPHSPCSALHTALTAAPQRGVVNRVRNSGGQVLKGTCCFSARLACIFKAWRQKLWFQNTGSSQINRTVVRHPLADFTMSRQVSVGCEMVH